MTNTKTKTKKLICVICEEPIIDDKYGHNAEPIKSGKCCSGCNYKIVIPHRFADLTKTS